MNWPPWADASTPSQSCFPLRSFKRDSQTAHLGEKVSYDTYLAAELAVDPPQSSTKRNQALTSSFAHAALERQLATLKADKGELKRKLKEKTLKVESLEQDQRWLADRETQERNEKEQEAANWEEEKVIILFRIILALGLLKSAAEIRTLRATLTVLKESHVDLEDTHKNLTHSTAQQKAQLTSLMHPTKFLESELKAACDLADECGREVVHLKDQLAAQPPNRPSVKENNSGDDEVIQAELQRQTAYLRDLERTNLRLNTELTRLRKQSTSIAVLQEEKRALEGKLVTMDGLRSRIGAGASAEVKFTAFQVLSEHGTILEQLATTKAALAAADAQIEEANCAFDALEAEKDNLEHQLSGVEEKMQTGNGEVKFLQALLASYTEESQIHRVTPDSPPDPAPAHLDELLRQYHTLKAHEERDRTSRNNSTQQAQGVKLKATEIALEQEKERVKEEEERAFHRYSWVLPLTYVPVIKVPKLSQKSKIHIWLR
ncbi:hypothetical protein H0H87_003568 [Tephrocybe sp. NHM501043]|nr:hypothetical protein H0H87_003568 [Tephrocybe sp. NHM501043]